MTGELHRVEAGLAYTFTIWAALRKRRRLHAATLLHLTEHRAGADLGSGEPRLDGLDGTQAGRMATSGPLRFLVRLAAADRDAQPSGVSVKSATSKA